MKVLNSNKISSDNALRNEHCLCRITYQATLSNHMESKYWPMVKMPGPGRLRSIAILYDAYDPWPQEVRGKFYLENHFTSKYKFDEENGSFTKICDVIYYQGRPY